MYSFDSKIASRGYHVYRNSTWQNAKSGDRVKVAIETNTSSKSINPFACAIKIKHKLFYTSWTVRHILREISCHCYFFLKESGNITGHLISTNYIVSPIPTVGSEVLLLPTFSVKSERIFELMKSFCQWFTWIWLYSRASKKQRRREQGRWRNWYSNNSRGECSKWK